LKKRSKKLLSLGSGACNWHRAKGEKVFWFFFSKKNILSLLALHMA
jgi:hypothetical protein